MNGKFDAIKTLLNTTKLDTTNVQQYGLAYDRMTVATSMQIVGTNSTGVMTIQPLVLASQGGTGFAFTDTTLNANLVVQANSAGSALTLDVSPTPASLRMYQWNHFL